MAEQERWVKVASWSELSAGMVVKVVYMLLRAITGLGECEVSERCEHTWARAPVPACGQHPYGWVCQCISVPEGRLYRLDAGLSATDEADRIRRCDADDARRAAASPWAKKKVRVRDNQPPRG